MPWNGSGTFAPLGTPEFPAVAGEIIYADYFNAIVLDLIDGLNNCVTRDFQEGDFWLSYTDSAKGAALIGYGADLNYPLNTVGAALDVLFESDKDLFGTANQITVTLTNPETLTLSLPNAVTFPGTARSVGVVDGGTSAAGYVGEYQEAVAEVSTALTTATNTDLASLVLQPGDYLVGGSVVFDPSAGFIFTYLLGWINTVATTPVGLGQQALTWGPADGTALPGTMHATNAAFPIPTLRLAFSTTTTIYLGAKSVFAAGTLSAGGTLWALRIR